MRELQSSRALSGDLGIKQHLPQQWGMGQAEGMHVDSSRRLLPMKRHLHMAFVDNKAVGHVCAHTARLSVDSKLT